MASDTCTCGREREETATVRSSPIAHLSGMCRQLVKHPSCIVCAINARAVFAWVLCSYIAVVNCTISPLTLAGMARINVVYVCIL